MDEKMAMNEGPEDQPLAQIRSSLSRTVGLATALALAGVLAFAAHIAGLATALAFATVHALAVMLAHARVGS